MYSKGDWVVYETGTMKQLGRVLRDYEDRTAVCYHEGCTAARTSHDLIRPYDKNKDQDLVLNEKIGHHRFHDHCPDYVPEACYDCDRRPMD